MELRPKSLKPGPGGTYVFDFRQNMVGWARLRVRGRPGTTVILRFAEALNPDGTIYTENLRRARSVDQYTLRGDADEVFEPTFTFHGFRYVELSGFPTEPTLDSVTGIVVGSDLPATGTFDCSNPLVNQIQSNLLWSQRGNFLEVPTDCPQRDERLGWMADAQVFLPTATFNMDCRTFFAKWMQDVIDSQSPEGGFSDVSPRMTDLNDGAPAWGDAGVFVPWTLYQAYGDPWILQKCFDAMSAWIGYLEKANPNHLWQNRLNGNMGDWLNINAETPKDLLATAYFAQSTKIVASSAEILNRPQDALRLNSLWQEIKAAFNREFVSEDASIKGDTQTAYALALRFDLLPTHLRALAAKRLVENIHRCKDHLSTGFVGVGQLLFALSDSGYLDLAYKLLLNETFPSWGYTIRSGATTIWERWNGWTDKDGFFYPEMNSFNHYAFGSVGQWMYESIAGINSDSAKPGYQHILLHPQLGGGLTRASASLDSVRGLIESNWQLKDQQFRWHVTVPPTATATAFIPSTDPNAIEEGGREIADNDQTTMIDRKDKTLVLKLAPGSYDFVSPFNKSGDLKCD
jgi:alpha-L-rhamnosidase